VGSRYALNPPYEKQPISMRHIMHDITLGRQKTTAKSLVNTAFHPGYGLNCQYKYVRIFTKITTKAAEVSPFPSGGMLGWGWGGAVRICSTTQTHPHPSPPLEREGATAVIAGGLPH